MNKDSYSGPIEQILAENPEVQRLRIDVSHQEVEAGFAGSLPGQPALETLASNLNRDLAHPEKNGPSAAGLSSSRS